MGNVLTTTTPGTPTARWSVASITANSLSGISCPTAALCVAVDQSGGVVDLDQPAGRRSHMDQRRGGLTQHADRGVMPVTARCASPSTGAASLLRSVNPTGGAAAWASASVDPQNSLNGVSCASSKLCVAVDDDGNALVSDDAGGIRPARGGRRARS